MNNKKNVKEKNKRWTLYRTLKPRRKKPFFQLLLIHNKSSQIWWNKIVTILLCSHFHESEIWKGYNRNGLSLLQHIWGLSWEHLKDRGDLGAGVWYQPQAFSHMSVLAVSCYLRSQWELSTRESLHTSASGLGFLTVWQPQGGWWFYMAAQSL